MRSKSVLTLAGLLFAAPALADHAVHTSRVALPDGFHPEGIAPGHDHIAYVAEFDTGAVLKIDVRTGKSAVLVPAQTGRQGLGLKLDQRTNYLFVCGGGTGHAYVYNAATGANVADYTLATSNTFINDVILTDDAAYFTDSSQPTFYKLPLGHHGQLPAQGAVKSIALAGDFQETTGFNSNGIVVTPEGKLIIVNSATGFLYNVDPRTGFAKQIDLGAGVNVVDGDGLLLLGHKLFVIENFTSTTAIVEMSHDFLKGKVVQTITSPDFDVTATAAKIGDALYITNARFEVTPTPTTPYWLTRVEGCD
jgi:sugar lactone lactonase YvrE